MKLANFYNRKFLLGTLLLLTVLAAVWPLPDHEPNIPEAVSGKSRPPSRAAGVSVAFAPLARKTAPGGLAAISDLFPQQTWTPPPPRPTAEKPQAPVAPPMPFTFAGRYTDGDKVTVFLMEGNQMHRAHQGDIIRENYRVDKIEQAAITLTYLPLNTTQALPTGVLPP